jgi:RpiB/LacA/LacB family sugar-phosphate isomerase
MRVVLGSDHAAFALKGLLVDFVAQWGHDVEDVGTYNDSPVDYPDIAVAVAEVITSGRADRGILLCGSGVGASVAANKIPGIRAGLCHDTYSAHQGVEHDNANVLVLGSRIIGTELAHELVKTFLAAEFSGEQRHVRRLDKVDALERRRQ